MYDENWAFLNNQILTIWLYPPSIYKMIVYWAWPVTYQIFLHFDKKDFEEILES